MEKESDLEQAICLEVQVESQRAIKEWNKLPESKEQAEQKIQHIIKESSAAPLSVFGECITIRIDYYLLPLVRKLVQIESELRITYLTPFTDERFKITRDTICNVIQECWENIVSEAYGDAIKHAIPYYGGRWPSYKEKELMKLRDEYIGDNWKKNKVFEELDLLLHKAKTDIELHKFQSQMEITKPPIQEIIMGNKYSFGNITGSNINIDSVLNEVTQTIGEASTVDEAGKKQLTELIEQLKVELQKIPSEKKDDADALAKTAKTLVEAGTEARPNKFMVQISADGLKKAAENIASVMPTVLTIAGRIVETVFRITGVPLP